MQLVFIIGIARTGSKIYMTSLNGYSDIDIVNEMHYLAPWYIRQDAVNTLRLKSTPLVTRDRVEKAVDKMYSGSVHGTFWDKRKRTETLQQRLVDMDRATVVEALCETDGTPKLLFQSLLVEHARVAGKKRAGAKFPVDISCVRQLIDWFPDAKLVHIIRDPRAIYSSMLEREVHGINRRSANRSIARFKRLPYLLLQFKRAARVHRDLQLSPNYHLSRFEDVTKSPEIYIPKLCQFLDTEYRHEMLNVKKVDSSYTSEEKVGIDFGAADRWRQHLTSIERKLIISSLHTDMEQFGYFVRNGAPTD